MSVWANVVGQPAAVAELERAVAEPASMTHAWLFTGPPGSGRSNAAIAFAAALQCQEADRGCGACQQCRTVLAGSHPDVTIVSTALLSLGVKEVRELVRRSAMRAVGTGWQIIVIEDADRLTEQAINALLKAIEEPAPRTVWMLCAPSIEDVLPTIVSRCRMVTLTTPTADDVAGLEHRHAPALARQESRRRQARDAAADDDGATGARGVRAVVRAHHVSVPPAAARPQPLAP